MPEYSQTEITFYFLRNVCIPFPCNLVPKLLWNDDKIVYINLITKTITPLVC